MSTGPTLVLAYHGSTSGSGSTTPPINNLLSFPWGAQNGAQVLDTSSPAQLNELRSFQIGPDGNLYLCSGSKVTSQIYAFAPPASGSTLWTALIGGSPYASENLGHPFDAVFGPPGAAAADLYLYVSNQNATGSNALPQLTYYQGPYGSLPGAYLGVFAASHSFGAPRGICWLNGVLWVADEGAGSIPAAVTPFNPDGSAPTGLSAITSLTSPVHVLTDGTYLYVGDKNTEGVWAFDPASQDIQQIITKVKDPSGMLLYDGYFYLGSRQTNTVYQYAFSASQWPPTATLQDKNGCIPTQGDNPEFVGDLMDSGAVWN